MVEYKYDMIWSIEAKVGNFRIELLILSLSSQFQDLFGSNLIFLPYSVTKL